MLTNILTQDFTDFAKIAKTPQKGIDTLLDFYVQSISNNESKLVIDYAERLLANKTPHIPDPRIYMRQNLLSLVQDSYALGISDGLDALADVQFSYEKTIADFAQDPNDRLQRDINKLQRDIQASQNIVRQTKTLNNYTKTLQGLQNQAQTLGNTQATQTLNGLANQLQSLKTGNTVRSATGLINKQLQKGGVSQQSAQNTVQQQILTNGSPNTQDYLIKRAIEEKLKYLQNRKDALGQTPPVVLEEDKDFFRWYSQKRIVPIANRYQQGLLDKNKEAQNIVTDYTEKINKGSITDAAKGDYQQRIINKILNIEDKVVTKGRPIKRVQRVVATELAIAYNIGRLKTYLKAGIQYVTISTSMYSAKPCNYCIDTEEKSLEQPIKISSLLKNAYKNDGFENKSAYEAGQNVPIEQRYLVSHPYCMCVYIPHPKKDDTQEKESEGIYNDPNTWKFILGAGLGVSLTYLAFALTTGKKINIPETIPLAVPKITLPVTTRVNAPETIPIDMNIPRSNAITPDLRDPLELRLRVLFDDFQRIAQTIPLTPLQKSTLDRDLIDIFRGNNKDLVDVISKTEKLLASVQTDEYAKDVIDVIAKKAGVIKELYFRRFDKVADRFNKTVSAQSSINKLQNKVQQYLDKVDGAAVINAANNIEKTKIDSQLLPITVLRNDLQVSLERVSARPNKKQGDIIYIADLNYRIADLDNFATILQQQKTQLQNIKASVVIVDKAMINQQIANTQTIVDRLSIDISVLEEAQNTYQDLLEMLIALPSKDVIKYKKIQTDLNRKIKSAQGITLKRFTGYIAQFKYE